MASTFLTIPLRQLVPSPANPRRTRPDAGLDALVASIAAHGLLQSLHVRPERDADGAETGRFRVVGGNRRLAALRALARRKALPRGFPVPCIVGDTAEGEEEASLAENVVREALHPADQVEAFRRLAEGRGLGAEAIAARFGVTPQVVRQRLRLAAVSPRLLQAYRDGALTLEQLTAFALTEDHARQEQVFDGLSWNREPGYIRRLLTEAHVRADDRRAVLVGLEAYAAAGGTVLRDLFQEDDGGWLEDVALLDRLALARLAAVAEAVKVAEGWKWAEARLDYPYGHGLRRAHPTRQALGPEQEARRAAVGAEREALLAEHDGVDPERLPAAVAARLAALAAEAEALAEPAWVFEPEDIARGGVLVALGHDGEPRVERGLIRPEDEPPAAMAAAAGGGANDGEPGVGAPAEAAAAEGEAAVSAGLSGRLLVELTAWRTAALREALARDPGTALVALTHALALQAFYREPEPFTCLALTAGSAPLDHLAPGLGDAAPAQALAEAHARWARDLPREPAALWGYVAGLDHDRRLALLAYAVARTIDAVRQPHAPRAAALAHADRLAAAVGLDLRACWRPTAGDYLGRVTKALILEAVREGAGEDAARRLAGWKKAAMAAEAEALLAGTGWLPPALRTPAAAPPVAAGATASAAGEPTALAAE